MTSRAAAVAESSAPLLTKVHATQPALIVTGPLSIAVRSGATFAGRAFDVDTPVAMPVGGLEVGADYAVMLGGKTPVATKLTGLPAAEVLGGFHFAPGGNAPARKGGDDIPQINPCSLWDRNFRPACADPRGMALVDGPRGLRFWCDIYLLGVNHLRDSTSKLVATIADGSNCPVDPATAKKFKRFEYAHAVAVMAHHGKQLLSFEEFGAAAFGVTERSACGSDPKVTGLDAPRTSKFGIMQATGNMWVWGHDGDPDEPRASIFGGSWLVDVHAGSRFAGLDGWPDLSGGNLGARGRSDHLQLG